MKPSWTAQHTERQKRLVRAIDRYITEETAEILDNMDNLLQTYFVKHRTIFLVSSEN